MTIELRRLTTNDLNLLRELRNANSDAFFDSRTITPESQARWWRCYHEANTFGELQFYVIMLNGITPAGFLSVRHVRDIQLDARRYAAVREIGNLLLAPAHRGRGIMTLAMVEASRLYDPLTFWIAHVKPDNTASLNLFDALDFCQITHTKGSRICPSRCSSTPTPPTITPASPASAAS